MQRVLRRVHSEASMQVSARAFVMHARRAGLSENHRILTHRLVPLIWRIDPVLRLPEHRLKPLHWSGTSPRRRHPFLGGTTSE